MFCVYRLKREFIANRPENTCVCIGKPFYDFGTFLNSKLVGRTKPCEILLLDNNAMLGKVSEMPNFLKKLVPCLGLFTKNAISRFCAVQLYLFIHTWCVARKNEFLYSPLTIIDVCWKLLPFATTPKKLSNALR